MISESVIKTLMLMTQLYSKEISEDAARMIAADLESYPEQALLAALSRCRKELKSFPTIAEIIARIEDGRPGVEEAWAMIPKDERDSVVWCEEMREAFAAARPLIDADPIAARQAFKEVYAKLILEARTTGQPPKWSPSFGQDKAMHQAAIQSALEKGRISSEYALKLLPELAVPAAALQLTGPDDSVPMPEELRPLLGKVFQPMPALNVSRDEQKQAIENQLKKLKEIAP